EVADCLTDPVRIPEACHVTAGVQPARGTARDAIRECDVGLLQLVAIEHADLAPISHSGSFSHFAVPSAAPRKANGHNGRHYARLACLTCTATAAVAPICP